MPGAIKGQVKKNETTEKYFDLILKRHVHTNFQEKKSKRIF